MRLLLGQKAFEFVATPLVFSDALTADLFARKNNKTLGETIQHPKYVPMASQIVAEYSSSLNLKLGEFILGLKRAGDPFYKGFLNKHGDGVYCEFRLADPTIEKLKGLYCFTVGNVVKYIGRSTDSFGKRINQGYGRIHPKNCYRDGQSTNCHLNALVAEVAADVRLHVHPMVDDSVIEATESTLIVLYNPDWNVQLRTG